MFLIRFRSLFSKLFGFFFRNRKRRSPRFTNEQFARVAEICNNCRIEEDPCARSSLRFTKEQFARVAEICSIEEDPCADPCDDDFDIDPPDCCPAIIPKGYVRVSDGVSTYAVLLACHNCGIFGDHLTGDCKIESCKSEYFRTRYPTIQPPEGSPFRGDKTEDFRRRYVLSELPPNPHVQVLPKNCSGFGLCFVCYVKNCSGFGLCFVCYVKN